LKIDIAQRGGNMTARVNIGDHLVTPRLGFTHHGIYVGDQRVIQYAGYIGGLSKKPVSITTLERFDNGFGFWVEEPIQRSFTAEESVERAFSRLGENEYNIIFNNCEHFVNWCVSGMHSSQQIKKYTLNAAAAGYFVVQKVGDMISRVVSRRRVV
jgi:hypothetical protein